MHKSIKYQGFELYLLVIYCRAITGVGRTTTSAFQDLAILATIHSQEKKLGRTDMVVVEVRRRRRRKGLRLTTNQWLGGRKFFFLGSKKKRGGE